MHSQFKRIASTSMPTRGGASRLHEFLSTRYGCYLSWIIRAPLTHIHSDACAAIPKRFR